MGAKPKTFEYLIPGDLEPGTYSKILELDLSNAVITSMTDFMDAVYETRINTAKTITVVYLNPTQEFLLRTEACRGLYDKKDQPLDPKKVGPLSSLMGLTVRIQRTGEDGSTWLDKAA